MPRIGVLAIQGDFAAHMAALREAGAEVSEVRKADDLRQVDGLVTSLATKIKPAHVPNIGFPA